MGEDGGGRGVAVCSFFFFFNSIAAALPGGLQACHSLPEERCCHDASVSCCVCPSVFVYLHRTFANSLCSAVPVCERVCACVCMRACVCVSLRFFVSC